jgi:PAS domain S-box-containing protein
VGDQLVHSSLPDAVITTTADGNVTYWSKGAQAMFGYTNAEAVGR